MRDLDFERRFFNRLFAGVGLAFILGLLSIFFGLELLLINTFWDSNQGLFWTLQGIWTIALSVVLATIFKLAQTSSG
jgi:hypothetical protein